MDLLETWHFIAQHSIDNANKVTDAIDAAVRDLQTMPGIGHRRDDVRDLSYRFWAVYSYIIAYRFNDEALTIVRVIHGARDFRRLFDERRL